MLPTAVFLIKFNLPTLIGAVSYGIFAAWARVRTEISPGDFTMALGYAASTINTPLLGLRNLLFTAGILFLTHQFLLDDEEAPMAHIYTAAYIVTQATYLLL